MYVVGQANVLLDQEDAEQDQELKHREQDIQASNKYVYAISKLIAGRHGISLAGNLLRRVRDSNLLLKSNS